MKRFYAISGLLAAVLACGAFPPLLLNAAENSGSEDLQLGNKAFAAGDYAAAERFYRKAILLLSSPLREQGAMQLCRVCLKRGESAAAYKILQELEERSPGFYTGVLRGMILAAEGNTAEAEKAFLKIADARGSDRFEALYHLGRLYLAAAKYQQALDAFTKLQESPVPSEKNNGLYGRIVTLIRQKRWKEAADLIGREPQDQTLRKLELLLFTSSGNLNAFRSRWQKMRDPGADPAADRLLYEVCRSGADLAAAANDKEFTLICLQDAFDHAPGDTERKDIMHQLFNLQSQTDPSAAIETIRHYRKIFPDAPDKALLQIQGGRLLASSGRYREAYSLFSEVVKDEENLLDERRSAAFDAAAAAEKDNMFAEAEQMYRYLINRSVTPDQKQRSELRLAEFFMRRKNNSSAEKLLKNVILQGGSLAESGRARLLQLQMDSEKYAAARETAVLLLTAANKKYADYSRFQLAKLAEQNGELENAKKLYLDFLKNAPRSTHAPAVRFSVAVLSEKVGDFQGAAKEYLDFAERYPQDPNAAPALFFALRADCISGEHTIAEKCLSLLHKNHAGSVEYGTAKLQLAHYFFNKGSADKALPLLEPDKNMNTDTLSASLLLKSRILLSGSDSAGALQILKELLEKYPASREAAEANLLSGNILADLGERKSALDYFLRAEKLRPGGLFGEIVSGRIADCLRELYSGNEFDGTLLGKAIERYTALADNAKLPALRLQSQCKAAICLELAQKSDKAADLYEKTLYYASLLKRSGVQPDPVWCAKAAYAGARTALKKNRPESLTRALRMLRLYEELELPETGEDFDSLRKKLRNSYNLLRRKEQK